jgi:hypothetical protein
MKSDRDSEDRLDRVCARFGIDGSDRFLVASLVGRPRSAWPTCCGSGCSPCIDDVTAAADALLAEASAVGALGNVSPTM